MTTPEKHLRMCARRYRRNKKKKSVATMNTFNAPCEIAEAYICTHFGARSDVIISETISVTTPIIKRLETTQSHSIEVNTISTLCHLLSVPLCSSVLAGFICAGNIFVKKIFKFTLKKFE